MSGSLRIFMFDVFAIVIISFNKIKAQRVNNVNTFKCDIYYNSD